MSLLIKFNLAFILVFAAGMAGSAYLSKQLLEQNAEEETVADGRLLMEKAIAVRNYTAKQIRPLLDTQLKYTFLPQVIPAYSATEVLQDLRKVYPDFNYKEATLNPTNPRDRAVEWEADIVTQFRNSTRTELVGERDTPTGRSVYVARPIKITDPGCLICHSTIEAAPKTLVDKYGPANGFGWNLNEVIGAQIVSVPTSVPLARADKTFHVFMVSLGGVFIAIAIILNFMLWMLVIRPVRKLSALADRVSLGEMEAPEFETSKRDEIGVLAQSFARMRKSLVQAMNMLEA